MTDYDMKKDLKGEYPEIVEKDLKILLEWWNKWKHLCRTTGNMPPPPFKK